MTDLVKKNQEALLKFLSGKEMGLDLPSPFERDIFLFDTNVAGTSFIEGIEEIEKTLQIGDKLVFYREPDNKFDPQAIRVETTAGQKIGYVPQQDNVVFARLMDAGKMLCGQIHTKEMRGKWLKMSMKIYLYEN